MMMKKKLAVTLFALALVAAACSSTSDDTTTTAGESPATTEASSGGETATTSPPTTAANTDPIKIGAVSSLTGPIVFPESSAAAAAVFERVNAEGGINGRQIEYIVEDDAADPAGAAQAARRLVEDSGVVAMTGSASLLECAVNAAFYGESGIYSIQGTGVDPLCFANPNTSPVNTGPYLGLEVSLYFASEILGAENVCMLIFDIPDFRDAVEAVVQDWTAITGKELLVDNRTMQFTDDVTPFVLEVSGAGCDVTVSNGLDVHYIGFMTAMQAQGIDDMKWVGLTSGYSQEVADSLGATGAGDGLLYTNSEFEPYLGDSPVLDDWRSLMTSAGVSLTSFAQGGYLSAMIMADVLRSIEGEITRESVAAALLALDSYDTGGMIGSPYSFGDKPAHNPNRASKFVQLQGSEWVSVTDDWIVLPTP